MHACCAYGVADQGGVFLCNDITLIITFSAISKLSRNHSSVVFFFH